MNNTYDSLNYERLHFMEICKKGKIKNVVSVLFFVILQIQL